MTGKVIANDGVDVKLGLDDGRLVTAKAGNFSFPATVGMTVDCFTDEDGEIFCTEHVVKEKKSIDVASQISEEFSGKSKVNKVTYLILCFLLGGGGLHKFYAKKYIQGALYLLFCWTYIPMVISFFEFLFGLFNKADENGDILV